MPSQYGPVAVNVNTGALEYAASSSEASAIADGTIVNADVNASAAIAYSKLALTGAIVNADVNASAAIAASKLSGVVTTATATTKGDLYVATASGTVTRLGVGSNDQVLTADSAQTPGVKWADASGGGIAATIADAKGDLIAASAADTVARLPVGADGTQLVADSAQSSGLRYVTSGAFPQTIASGLVGGAATLGTNTGWYILVTDGGVQSISNLTVVIGTSSGNISVAVYSSTGSGRTRAPASRLQTSGAVASPGTGERTIALGGAVTVVPYETWFFISADNNTVTFQRAISSASETLKGIVASQATAHPAPTSAGSLTSGAFGCYWIAGS